LVCLYYSKNKQVLTNTAHTIVSNRGAIFKASMFSGCIAFLGTRLGKQVSGATDVGDKHECEVEVQLITTTEFRSQFFILLHLWF
jgi:hypothetical protein